MKKTIEFFFALFSSAALFAAGPGGGGTPPGGGGNQPGGGGGATFTFDTFLATTTTNSTKCLIREGVWTGWASGIMAATLDSSVSTLAAGVCSGCTTLTSVNLSSTTITEIPESAFAGCSNLVTVILPSTCTTIGANAFAGCMKLATLTAPGVTTVGADSFRACSVLTAIPAAVRTAGAFSFAGSGMSSVDLAGVTSVGDGALADCIVHASRRIGRSRGGDGARHLVAGTGNEFVIYCSPADVIQYNRFGDMARQFVKPQCDLRVLLGQPVRGGRDVPSARRGRHRIPIHRASRRHDRRIEGDRGRYERSDGRSRLQGGRARGGRNNGRRHNLRVVGRLRHVLLRPSPLLQGLVTNSGTVRRGVHRVRSAKRRFRKTVRRHPALCDGWLAGTHRRSFSGFHFRDQGCGRNS